jgi:cytochrome c oxidase subunit II
MKNRIRVRSVMAGVLMLFGGATLVFASAADTPRKINVVAKKFAYDPAEITVKKGEPIALELTTADVAHGIKFKDLDINTKIEKGKSSELLFTPAKTGDFVGHCSVFCGSGHGSMTLTIHVTE